MAVRRSGYYKESVRRIIRRRSFYLSMLVAIVAVWLLGSLFIFQVERAVNPTIQNYGDAVWLSIVTMTTVGYGDVVPITVAGRVICMVTMVMGIVLVTTAITARATLRIEKARERRGGLDKQMKLRDHFVVCGWNARGEFLIDRLASGHEAGRTSVVLLCDLDSSPVDEDHVFFMRGNPTVEKELRRANIEEARAVVVLADDTGPGKPCDIDARTVLTALTIKGIAPESRITAEVLEPENKGHLERAGVDEILDYNLLAGHLMAQSALRFGVIDLVMTIATRGRRAMMYRIPVPADLVGLTVAEATKKLIAEKEMGLASVIRDNEARPFDREEVIEEGDSLAVFADKEPPDAIKLP